MRQARTSFANTVNPFTNRVPLKTVPIPKVPKPRKGSTKYDEEFVKLLEFKSAIESSRDGAVTLRRALGRFLQFRNLRKTISIRTQLNKDTQQVTLWLEKKDGVSK